MEVSIKKINSSRMIFLMVALIPLWWILGAKFFIFHLISFGMAMVAGNYKNRRRYGTLKFLNYGIFLYLVMISIALLRNNLEFENTRILAQFYIMTFWIVGVLIVNSICSTKKINLKLILKGFYILAISTVVVFFLSIIVWNIYGEIPQSYGLISYVWPDSIQIDTFKELMQSSFLFVDSIYNEVTNIKEVFYRFNGFYIYPTEGAMATLFVLVYSLLYLKITKTNINRAKNKYKIFNGILVLSLFIALYYFRSRTIILGSLVAMLITIFISNINKENYKKILTFSAIGIFVIVTLALLLGIFDKLMQMRPGSNVVRGMVYNNTIDVIRNNPLGVGAPYRIEGLDIPVGSHSTYLGTLMKGGVIGFLGIIIMQVSIFIQVIKNKKYCNTSIKKAIWNATTYLFIMTSIWMCIDDIDWAIIVNIMYFINVGIIFVFKNIDLNIKSNSKENYKIALVGSSGGHLTHLMQLEKWWKKNDRVWVTFDKPDARSQLKEEKVYWCYYPTNRNIKNLFKNTILSIKILFIERPDIIISSGAASAIPFFYLGKLFGCKLVYIEVYDRIDSPTVTGKIIYPIADIFIVQWDEQLKFYPKAVMLGGVF